MALGLTLTVNHAPGLFSVFRGGQERYMSVEVGGGHFSRSFDLSPHDQSMDRARHAELLRPVFADIRARWAR